MILSCTLEFRSFMDVWYFLPVAPLVSVVIPMCGSRSALGGYMSDVLGRVCYGFRLLLVSSNDPSHDKRVYSTCTTESDHIQMCRGGGNKIDATHGLKIRITYKS